MLAEAICTCYPNAQSAAVRRAALPVTDFIQLANEVTYAVTAILRMNP